MADTAASWVFVSSSGGLSYGLSNENVFLMSELRFYDYFLLAFILFQKFKFIIFGLFQKF